MSETKDHLDNVGPKKETDEDEAETKSLVSEAEAEETANNTDTHALLKEAEETMFLLERSPNRMQSTS